MSSKRIHASPIVEAIFEVRFVSSQPWENLPGLWLDEARFLGNLKPGIPMIVDLPQPQASAYKLVEELDAEEDIVRAVGSDKWDGQRLSPSLFVGAGVSVSCLALIPLEDHTRPCQCDPPGTQEALAFAADSGTVRPAIPGLSLCVCNQSVILDTDLTRIHDVKTRALNQAGKRHP